MSGSRTPAKVFRTCLYFSDLQTVSQTYRQQQWSFHPAIKAPDHEANHSPYLAQASPSAKISRAENSFFFVLRNIQILLMQKTLHRLCVCRLSVCPSI
jgi:hypothetical protein